MTSLLILAALLNAIPSILFALCYWREKEKYQERTLEMLHLAHVVEDREGTIANLNNRVIELEGVIRKSIPKLEAEDIKHLVDDKMFIVTDKIPSEGKTIFDMAAEQINAYIERLATNGRTIIATVVDTPK